MTLRILLVAAAIAVPAAGADELAWEFEGYAKIPVAAAKAKAEKKRLLFGLSGSDT